MLLSKRRLRWAAVALLIACGLLLTQPTRVWLQRTWIAAALGPQVTVGEVVYHAQNSIVEVRDLTWQGNNAVNSHAASSGTSLLSNFTVKASRCWLGIDRQSLADGRIDLPKVILQDAVVTLDNNFLVSNVGLQDWRHGVVRHLAQFDWETLNQQVSCLTAADDLATAWSHRTQDLIDRSRSILTEAGRIEVEAAAMDNPLRFEDSIRARLTRFKELSVEQQLLFGELTDIKSELTSETERLKELHRQDVRALERLCFQLQDRTSTDSQAFTLDRQLALAIAQASWNQIAPYGEVVASTSHAAATMHAADYDVTVRPAARSKDHIHCFDLKASGEFRNAQFTSPFQASGQWRVAQQRPGAVFRELNCLTSFDCRTSRIEVTADHDSRRSTGIQLRIRMLGQAVAEGTNVAATAGVPVVNLPAPVTATLSCNSGALSGTLRVSAEAFVHLSQRLPRDLLDSLQASSVESAEELPELALSEQALQFELSGTWDQPNLELSGSAPDWLTQAVERMLSDKSEEVIAQSYRKLATEFDLRSEQMRERVISSASQAQAMVARDENALLSSQQRLQQRFDEMNGTEFARRPGELQR